MNKYKKITEDMEFCKFDGVTETAVYVGSLTNLTQAKINWRSIGYRE